VSGKNPFKGDRFTAQAKKDGFPARSVYKLEEIDKRVKLLRAGMNVLDLGAFPGSWSMYAAAKIAPKGRLFAIDLKQLAVPLPTNAQFEVGDAFTFEEGKLATFAPYDVVLSDMAPNTTGNRLQDQTRSFDLFMRALDVAAQLSKPGGAFVGKIFMGEDFPLARKRIKELYAEDRVIRPESVRSVSYEVFIVGIGRRSVESGVAARPNDPVGQS
jgi:23S rRNA (uridine2552-2'-O)-methyltransferase